jgi:AcrR family transcriptional regulator
MSLVRSQFMSTTSLFLRAVPPPADWEDARGTPAALVRARIFDAMTRAVADKGYAATTVSDVTARSRISRRTFYENFADKEECFLLAYESASQATLQSIATATRGVRADDWRRRLGIALATYVGILAEDPQLAQVTLIDILGAGPAALAIRERVLEQYTDFYRRLAARACQAGAMTAVPDAFLRGLVGAIAEIVQHELLAGRVRELPDLVPTLEQLTLTMLGEPPAHASGEAARRVASPR